MESSRKTGTRFDAAAYPANWSLEARLVASAASGFFNPASGKTFAELDSDGAHWDEVCRIAAWHGVLPIVYRFIVSTRAGLIPDAVIEQMRARFHANAVSNLILARELHRIVGLLASENISAIALKGPALACDAYGDLAMRQFTDLDIFIRSRDLPQAANVFAAMGYLPRRYDPSAAGGGFFQSSEDEFVRADGQLIDLHWRLLPYYFPFSPGEDRLWSSAAMIVIHGTPILTLAPTDHLMFSIAHATKHGWPLMRQICDVAAFAGSHREIDWSSLDDEARRLGCRRMFLLAVILARDIVGAAVPARLVESARKDRRVVALKDGIAARLFSATGERPGLYHEWIVPLRSIEGVSGRVRYLIERGLKPTIDDWEFIALPRSLYPAYYLLRPLRLVTQHGPRLFRNPRTTGAHR